MLPKILLCLAASAFLGTVAQAHFPWLSTDDQGRALLYFAESPQKTDYRLPDAIAGAQVMLAEQDKDAKQLDLEKVETDDFIGLQSKPDTVGAGVLTSACEYGNYHGTLLTYFAKHYAGDASKSIADEPEAMPTGFALDARPELTDDALEVRVTREAKPVDAASVTLIDPNGERAEKETDSQGIAKFYNVRQGRLGLLVGVSEEAEGEAGGEKYTSKSYYLTLTLNTAEQPAPERQSALPLLPQRVASFGAAVVDDYVYVYSGHTGTAHDHSSENLSPHFCRMALAGGDWEELPMQQPLQGLPLVPHHGKLYRVGGMYAANGPDDEEDLQSVDEVAAFDPAAKQWTTLPPLPEPRSSHDAVAIDGWLYVVGGWQLAGDEEGQWHDTAWKLRLADTTRGWQPVPALPEHRRALAVAHADGLLVAIGGLDDAGAISRRVDALDLSTGEWRQLADLPGDGMHGFGMSAWNHQGTLYASGSEGEVYRLDVANNQWQSVAKLDDRRFFHRLLPAGKNRLLMIGGASIDREGHVADSEWVQLGGGS